MFREELMSAATLKRPMVYTRMATMVSTRVKPACWRGLRGDSDLSIVRHRDLLIWKSGSCIGHGHGNGASGHRLHETAGQKLQSDIGPERCAPALYWNRGAGCAISGVAGLAAGGRHHIGDGVTL